MRSGSVGVRRYDLLSGYKHTSRTREKAVQNFIDVKEVCSQIMQAAPNVATPPPAAAMDTHSEAPIKVLLFPWLAFGHISPFLLLAKKLADRGFCTYLCSTPINLDSIKNKITQKYAQSINLVEFHLESTPDFPPHLHTTNGLAPHLQPTLRKALHKAKPKLSEIFDNLKPDLLIYDMHQSWTAALSCRHNIPAVKFLTSSAAVLASFCHMSINSGVPFPFPEIYLTDFEQARAQATYKAAKKDHDEEAEEGDLEITKRPCDNIVLLKSSREFEAKYIDYLSDLMVWKITPFFPLLDGSIDKEDEEHELISWLGTKTQSSSVFVSFGSEYFLNKEELEEIAFGLEFSEVNFIWVLRFPKGGEDSIEKVLPEGFLDRVGDKGRIINGWAPQARILSHPNIGGFVSHCGWNSVLEAIEIGVPIIAVPMHLDQPFNARLVMDLGVGAEVKTDGDGKLNREEIAGVVKDVVNGTAGEDARRKVREIGQKLKAREKDDLDGVVEMLKTLRHDK